MVNEHTFAGQTRPTPVRDVLERINDGVVAFDANLNYSYVNPRGAQLLGRSPAELVGKNYWQEFPEAEGTPFAEAYQRALDTQEPIVLEDYYEPWDRWFENRIYPSPEGLTIFFTEITARKETEAELRRGNRALRMLSDCHQALIRATDESALLEDVCRIIVDVGGYRLAWVGFAEEDEAKTVQPLAQAGYEEGYLETLDVIWAETEGGRGRTGTAVRIGEPLISRSIATDPEFAPWREDAAKRGYASSIALPLMDNGETLGALNVYAPERDALDPREIELLAELAHDLAFGLQTLRTRAKRERAEESLQRAQALLQQTQRLAKVGGWEYDVQTGQLTWTDEVYCIYGVDPETYDPNDIERDVSFYAPQEQDRLAEAFRLAVERGEPYDLELEFHNAQGERLWVRPVGHAEQRDGKVVRVYGHIMDITERKQMERALRRSEERFSTIFAKAAFAATLSRLPDGVLVDVNEAFERAFGYARQEAIGKTSLELGINPDAEGRARILAALEEQGAVHDLELTLHTKSGEPRVFSVNVDLVDIGHQKYILNTTRDITDRVRAEEETRRRSGHLITLLEVSKTLGATLDLETVLQATTDGATELMGLETAAVYLLEDEELRLQATTPPLDSETPEAFLRAPLADHPHIRDVITTNQPVLLPDAASAELTPEERTISDARGLRTILYLPLLARTEVLGVLIVSTVGEPQVIPEAEIDLCRTLANLAALAVQSAQLYEEVTEYAVSLERRVSQRTAELRVAKEQAESADGLKSAFLATMSHELRTPLNSIIGFTGILMQELAGPLNPEQKKQLHMLQNSARHLLSLINDMLDISKIEAGELELAHEPFDMHDAIESVVQTITPLTEEQGLALTVDIGPDVGAMMGDRRRVEQILLNLLNNAVKFTDEGKILLTSHVEGDHVVTSVRDTGIGLSADDIAKLFQPFGQIETGLSRQYEGTGLGLSICQRLVDAMGGEIWAESEGAGEGSRFTFTLGV